MSLCVPSSGSKNKTRVLIKDTRNRSKVRLTNQDIEEGNTERAEIRMNENDGGLARHSSVCQKEIDW